MPIYIFIYHIITWISNFDRILVLNMNQKLSHFGELNSCLGDLRIWLVPEIADTPCPSIKMTVVHFRRHIGSQIGQIWLYQISQKLFFEIFSVILWETTLSLALQYWVCDVKKRLRQQNRDFTHSLTPRSAPLGRPWKKIWKFKKALFQQKRSNILGSKTPKH